MACVSIATRNRCVNWISVTRRTLFAHGPVALVTERADDRPQPRQLRCPEHIFTTFDRPEAPLARGVAARKATFGDAAEVMQVYVKS